MNEHPAQDTDTRKSHHWLFELFLAAFALLVSLPIYIIVASKVPDKDWIGNLDRILLFAGLLFLIYFLCRILRYSIAIITGLSFMGLAYGHFFGNYSFSEFYNDYKDLVGTMGSNKDPVLMFHAKISEYKYRNAIRESVNPEHPNVQALAEKACSKHFKNSRTNKEEERWKLSLSLFKSIRDNWNYKKDPGEKELFRKASDSALSFEGDCDDYSILMLACLRATGEEGRLVHTMGHLYPELYVGEEKEYAIVKSLIYKLFKRTAAGEAIYAHQDENGHYWLNLDYTALHPGGKFMSEEIIGIIR